MSQDDIKTKLEEPNYHKAWAVNISKIWVLEPVLAVAERLRVVYVIMLMRQSVVLMNIFATSWAVLAFTLGTIFCSYAFNKTRRQ